MCTSAAGTEAVGEFPAYRGTLHRTTRELLAWHEGAPHEAALEPELPIVDAHHHLYGTEADAHHYRFEDLERDFSGGHRVLATVYVEAYEPGWRTEGPQALRPVGEVERIVAHTRTPTRDGCQVAAGIVAHADLNLGAAVAEVLAAHEAAAEGRLRGVRHVTPCEAGVVGRHVKGSPRAHLLMDPAFRQGAAQLARFGLSFDAWVYHPQLHELCDFAAALPDTPIVINHMGGLIGVAEDGYRTHRATHLAQWRSDLRRLAQWPNVSIKVGGLGMPVFGFGFEHADRPPASAVLARAWAPLIHTCIDIFGTQRCMFEANFPVDKQSCGYTALWNAFKRVTAPLSVHERDDLFRGTATRVYRLERVASGR